MKAGLQRGSARAAGFPSAALTFFEGVSEFAALAARTLRATVTRPFYFDILVEQFLLLIVRSAPLVLITGISTGAVMALQFGYGMERFGGKLYVPTVVAVSIVRVLGPIFTCLMLAARAGAGVAAELGSMSVTQQVDAIRALGTDPVRKLVVPRVIVLVVGAPLLTLLVDLFGILGGMLVSASSLQIPFAYYISKSNAALTLSDVAVGTGKTIVYGALIGLISCFEGLRTHAGTAGIGTATTRAVVLSSIAITLADVLFTKLSWILKW